jgi:hypothetical protein
MRIFQNGGLYPSYRPRLQRLTQSCTTFSDSIDTIMDDRFTSVHYLNPVHERKPEAFFTFGDSEVLQRIWAREQGIGDNATLEEILLAQIEHHRADVFYNINPVRFGDDFIAKLPGCVRRTIAWRAAAAQNANFFKYDLVVGNFHTLLEKYEQGGARTAYFFPTYDPAMDQYAANQDRPVDILFIGTYSRHHRTRVALLEKIAAMHSELNIALHLDYSNYVRLAETPLGWFGPLRKDRRSSTVKKLSRPPLFGRDLLNAISRAKIVVNGAIDVSGNERGNMRIWEALGCRAMMLSNAGDYPANLRAGEQFLAYQHVDEVPKLISDVIDAPARSEEIANQGHLSIKSYYSKERAWELFCSFV